MSTMTVGYTSLRGRLSLWNETHRRHEIVRDVVYVLDDDALDQPPPPEITLRCRDCGESMLIGQGETPHHDSLHLPEAGPA